MAALDWLDGKNRVLIEVAYRAAFVRMLELGEKKPGIRILKAISRWRTAPGVELRPVLEIALEERNPDLREAAAGCIHHLEDGRMTLFLLAAGDSHPRVRLAAVDALRKVDENYDETMLGLLRDGLGSPRAQQVILESLFDSVIPPSEFGDIAVSKAGEAYLFQQALHTLNNENVTDSGARNLIAIALQERLKQTIQLALLALDPLHEPGLVNTIRAGFASEDERHIANASEVLDTLDCNYASVLLDKVLHNKPDNVEYSRGNPFREIKDVIEWCANHTDKWLSECGRYAWQQLYPENSRA